ncbi:MAG: NUDIX domain-containing protein, partial [Muribaculaceae bacterium]|nr:NUDIX domain-containing protein [Muribaculaceae bacterium]
DIQPGKWDTAVGGHVDLGENIYQALEREAREELGLSGFEPELLRQYVFESDRERELVNTFKTVSDMVPAPSGELDGGRFWSAEEIADALGKEIFTPNFESEYKMLFL